jgi:predicted O-methyltransferase YrrM
MLRLKRAECFERCFENKRFVDIGTFHGFSALAPSFDKDATVTTC